MKRAYVFGIGLLGLMASGAGAQNVAPLKVPPGLKTPPSPTQPAQLPQQQPTATPGDAKAPVLLPNSTATTKYDPSRGFPDHNGDLSGMLVVIPQAELSEFDRPADAGRHLDRVARAEPGAKLAIKLVFTGVKPDWNNNVNVTYDLQVVGPDGKIYGKSNYHGMVAAEGRVPVNSGPALYDNRPQVVIIQFEPKDPVGLYRVRAVMHDKVSGLDLPLDAGVELLAKGAPVAAPVAAAPVATATPAATAQATMSPVADDGDDATPAKGKKKHHRRRRR